MTLADDGFILELLNEPEFLRNIGDKGARTLDDARRYILTGPVASYEQYGFGLWLIELKESSTPIGMCGLLKRGSMKDVEIGFALLSRFCRKGYACESAAAVMTLGIDTFGLKRISAITAPDNQGSMNVLGKVGLKFQEMIRLPEYQTDQTLYLYELG